MNIFRNGDLFIDIRVEAPNNWTNSIRLNINNLPELQNNRNDVLKHIDSNTIAFFEENGVSLDKNYIHDRDYKYLINNQLSSYEKISLQGTNIFLESEDHEPIAYTNNKDLFEDNFKNGLIDDFENLAIEEIENSFPDDLLQKLSNNDSDINKAYKQAIKYRRSIKDVDRDNDGIPDRIDIDDNRNSVQTPSDLMEVGNSIDKEHNREVQKHNKSQSR